MRKSIKVRFRLWCQHNDLLSVVNFKWKGFICLVILQSDRRRKKRWFKRWRKEWIIELDFASMSHQISENWKLHRVNPCFIYRYCSYEKPIVWILDMYMYEMHPTRPRKVVWNCVILRSVLCKAFEKIHSWPSVLISPSVASPKLPLLVAPTHSTKVRRSKLSVLCVSHFPHRKVAYILQRRLSSVSHERKVVSSRHFLQDSFGWKVWKQFIEPLILESYTLVIHLWNWKVVKISFKSTRLVLVCIGTGLASLLLWNIMMHFVYWCYA